MNHRHDLRALPHRRSDSLHRAGADVADGEHAGPTVTGLADFHERVAGTIRAKLAKRRIRSISAAWRIGNICSRRASMNPRLRGCIVISMKSTRAPAACR